MNKEEIFNSIISNSGIEMEWYNYSGFDYVQLDGYYTIEQLKILVEALERIQKESGDESK